MRFGKIFAKYLWRIIRQESMPVWLTLVLIIVGAILTNYYVPKLNQDFEKEKREKRGKLGKKGTQLMIRTRNIGK